LLVVPLRNKETNHNDFLFRFLCNRYNRRLHQTSNSLCRVDPCFLPLYFLLSPLEIFPNP
jgi:hypothetical protein